MRKFIFFLLLSASAFSDEQIGLIPSSEEQIVSLNEHSSLIGGCIHPLSGQLILKSIDLIAKGAQELSFTRVFIPASIIPTW